MPAISLAKPEAQPPKEPNMVPNLQITESEPSPTTSPLGTASSWIWTGPSQEENGFREAVDIFTLKDCDPAAEPTLHIAAHAFYQAWLNDECIGSGPAKSPADLRFVDLLPLSCALRPGSNILRILVHAPGEAVSSTYPGEPGLRYEVRAGDRVLAASGPTTMMRVPPGRSAGARRWMLPPQEVVVLRLDDGTVGWQPATVVERSFGLRPRRVPLPTRETFTPVRLERADHVTFPELSVSFVHRIALATPEELASISPLSRPACIVTDIHSPVEQTLEMLPAMARFVWHAADGTVWPANSWNLEEPKEGRNPVVRLRVGPNRLVGVPRPNDVFAAAHLVGRCEHPVRFANPLGTGAFQLVRAVDPSAPFPESPCEFDWRNQGWELVPTPVSLFREEFNLQDRVNWAIDHPLPSEIEAALSTASPDGPWQLPPAPVGEASRVILDLGRVRYGRVAFDVDAVAGSRLVLSMFESVEPGPERRINWCFQTANALACEISPGKHRFESLFAYGVRYLAIHHTGPRPLRLESLRVVSASCSRPNAGAFTCSCPRLTAIYEMCVNTIIASTDDTYTDCPAYEQVNWNFDNRMACEIDLLTTRNLDIAFNSMAVFAETPEPSGLIRSQFPAAWNPFIPNHVLQWLLWWADFTGIEDYRDRVLALWPQVRACLEFLLERRDPSGLLSLPGAWNFLDWGHGRDDTHAVITASQAAFAGVLQRLAGVAEEYGLPGEPGIWRTARTRLIDSARKHLWSPERGAFADSLHDDGCISPVSSQTTNAMCCLYGLTTEAEAAGLADRIAAEDPTLLRYGSPYGLYFIFQLLDLHGHTGAVFRLIEQHWGAMLDAGDLTAWEHFPHGAGGPPFGFLTRSRCHPSGTHVLAYLLRHVLGWQGPDLGTEQGKRPPGAPAHVNWARGRVPLPEGGMVEIAWSDITSHSPATFAEP